MKRTNHAPTNGQPKEINPALVQAYASIAMARREMAQSLGQQYGTARDLYKALGYPTEISYQEYLARYTRQDIAGAIIDRPANATWQGKMKIVEKPHATETKLEKEWLVLAERLKLRMRFSRLDKLSGIGEYGVLLLGLDDVQNSEGLKNPVKKGQRKLLYVTPFSQGNAKIEAYVDDPGDPRFGLPLMYKVNITSEEHGDTTSGKEVQVHYSRIIHVVTDPLDSEVKGAPRLERVFNRLMDLEKLVGGDAEMFWRGARPGYAGMLDPNYQMNDETKDDLKDQIDEYEHNLRRILINEGFDLKALEQQIADPANHVDVQIQMISAATGIPKRILTGSERGELASTQDRSAWLEYVQTRREEFADPVIVRPFVDRCVEYKILPTPSSNEGQYEIIWEDLFVLNEKARVEVGKGRAMALREYTQNPVAEAIMPPKAFAKYFLGLTETEYEEIFEMMENEEREERQIDPTPEELELMANEGDSKED